MHNICGFEKVIKGLNIKMVFLLCFLTIAQVWVKKANIQQHLIVINESQNNYC